jgi:hypothetical protein
MDELHKNAPQLGQCHNAGPQQVFTEWPFVFDLDIVKRACKDMLQGLCQCLGFQFPQVC